VGHVFRGHYPGFMGKSGAGLVTIIAIIMVFYVSMEFNKGSNSPSWWVPSSPIIRIKVKQ
jgi:hypothetical protein